MVESGNFRIPKKALQTLYPDSGYTYYEFLSNTRDGRCMEAEDIKGVCSRLLNGRALINDNCLSTLRHISSMSKADPKHSVRTAIMTLREYFAFSPSGEQLRQEGMLPILYGSLEYGDPKNLDADILIVADKPLTAALRELSYTINRELITLWRIKQLGLTKQAEPHSTPSSLSDNPNLEKLLERPEELIGYADDLSIVMSGIPVFDEDTALWQKFNTRARDITESDPLICALVNQALVQCLKTRTARRNKLTSN